MQIVNLQVFLLNLSFIFFLYFVYYGYIEGKIKNSYSHKILIGVMSVLAIILSMTFPTTPIPGFSFDMRQVFFIIGAIYGGRRVAVSLLLVILTYRFFIGADEGFYVSIILFSLIFLILLYAIPKFKQAYTTKEKVKIALYTSIGGNTIFAILLVVYGALSNIQITVGLLSFYGIQTVAIFLFVLFIERAKKEQMMLNEIKKLEKLRVVSDIAASISHEVRNPLTVTKGFLQLLREPDIPHDKQVMYVNLSIEELERAEAIIADYLTFAKPSLEHTEIIKLDKEIEYIKQVILPYATMHNVEVYIEAVPNLYIFGERQKLHQCMMNIMKNSIEAMPNGGILTIRMSQSEGQAVLLFEDTGTGMTEEQIDRLGTPYYSTKDKGTGLGMMVVFSLVKIMSGQVTVTSEKGKGTSITISFPLARDLPFKATKEVP